MVIPGASLIGAAASVSALPDICPVGTLSRILPVCAAARLISCILVRPITDPPLLRRIPRLQPILFRTRMIGIIVP